MSIIGSIDGGGGKPKSMAHAFHQKGVKSPLWKKKRVPPSNVTSSEGSWTQTDGIKVHSGEWKVRMALSTVQILKMMSQVGRQDSLSILDSTSLLLRFGLHDRI